MQTLTLHRFCGTFLCLVLFLLPTMGQDVDTNIGKGVAINSDRFVNPLPIPHFLNPLQFRNVTKYDTIRLRIDEVAHNFNPNGDTLNVPITSFAFNHMDSTHLPNTILGPTIRWRFKDSLHVEVLNNLDEITTTHWHGAHVPTWADGGPHQPIMPDSIWRFDIDVKDKSATMWYHPHRMGTTYEHVQMGLSGMLYVDDPPQGDDDSILVALHDLLPNDYGVNDFPLIIQTKRFGKDKNGNDTISTVGFNKEFNYMVNGMMNPHLEVPADIVRFRVLNGDAKYAFKLGLYNEQTSTRESFEFIATDAGYTDTSYTMSSVLISPGERTEWLVDLRDRTGDTLYLVNVADSIPASIIGSSKTISGGGPGPGDSTLALLKIAVGNPLPVSSNIQNFPIPLHPQEIPHYDDDTKERIKVFYRSKAFDNALGDSSSVVFNIDKVLMHMGTINDTVLLNDTEIWTIDNRTNIAHPFHIHDIHFHVIKILYDDTLSTGAIVQRQIPNDSLPHIFSGPKDNVLVESGWTVSFVTKFDDFGSTREPQNSYMYHCHILPHEDRGMMGQFVVWDPNIDPDPEVVTTSSELVLSKTIKLYPNPAFDQLNLEGSSVAESQLRIFDMQGRLLQSQMLAPFDGVQSIDVQQIITGIVLVEWETVEGRFVKKVVLK